MKKNKLVLIRGVSGSGKTTFGELICGDYPLFSADNYFMKDGNYLFNAIELKEAHADCLNKTIQAMNANTCKIFVANTFTREWEMVKYFELAIKYNYDIFSIIVENRHNNENVHNVSKENIEKMKERFEIKL